MECRTRVLWTERAEFLPGWGIKEHAHNYYHLFYPQEGSGSFWVDRTEYQAKPGIGFLVQPNTLHELKKVNDRFVCCEIKFIILDETLRSRLETQAPVFEGNTFLDTAISYVVENGRSRLAHYIQNTDDYLCALLVHMVQDRAEPESSNSGLIDTAGFSEVTVRIVNYIEKNYMKHVYLDDIAAYVEYNRNYICSVFKKDAGMTVFDYLNYVRIRKACEYISYSDIDIGQVCYRVGFTNVGHFNRTFKKFTGMAPGAFNKLYPLDISGEQKDGKRDISAIDTQVLTIAKVLGTLHNPKSKGAERPESQTSIE